MPTAVPTDIVRRQRAQVAGGHGRNPIDVIRGHPPDRVREVPAALAASLTASGGGERIRAARIASGLTQTELSRRSGIAQPNISAIERGDVRPRSETVERLVRATRRRPSELLRLHRDEVVAVIARHRATRPRIFGSTATGEDTPDSDVDLLVEFDDEATLLDLVRMADELEALLGVHVDIVDDRGDSRVLERARGDGVPL